MKLPEVETPSYYKPGAILTLQLAPDDITCLVEVIKPFIPFTISQVLLCKPAESQTEPSHPLIDQLPEAFIVKVYDPRYMDHRLPFKSRPARPWSLDGEQEAATRREERGCPGRDANYDLANWPEEDDDKPGWEEWYFQSAEDQYYHESEAYKRLEPVQGVTIPRCYGYGTLKLPQRAISPHILVIEYISDAETLEKIDPACVPPELAQSLLNGIKEVNQLGVVHTDLNPGNILLTPRDRPTRAVVIDFGHAGLREEEDDETWREVLEENDDPYWMRARLKRSLGEDILGSSGAAPAA
ncbi:SubName: Full=Uncharacterized protein {ECO:0000313/EMBL:CCA66792.1} [Serendipita indica DSM 11827]|uniref:Protein kinase domain-containing protein n=1 Tax=Serendipita indica (strain DSM 11827) TaxID=1109443 RepID=G4T600_SERID|nr:SubName: Full=Uncharacterized protein {ECO:0000313/EMBL:CCA66792.1} [Serendipita indica DSM 11827]CCA66792.1 hypothetical protein PIIN_00471 [Serendipita indica DSM 11827]